MQKTAITVMRNRSKGQSSHFRCLEEIAVLRIIQLDSSAKQAFIAKEIKKSERTVKTITARLTEKGIIKHSKGKGSDWMINYE